MKKFFHVYHRRRNDRNAARWFARVADPDCADADRAAFARWRAEDPEHACAYSEVELLWRDGADATQRADVLQAARAALRRPPKGHAAKRRWIPAFAALAVILGASVAAWFGWISHDASTVPSIRYTTVTGQQREVRLKDGSTLLLDTATTVVVRYRAHRREVDLLRGRVQFNVEDNRSDPFEVSASGGTVTDLGTVFQMGVTPVGVEVVLLRGRVLVTTRMADHAQSATLEPGEQLRYRAGMIGAIREADTLAAGAWTRGQIVADNWPLQRLLFAMNRYSHTKLVIGDPSLRSIRLSAVLRAGDQRALVQSLQQGWSIRTRLAAPDEVVLFRDSGGSQKVRRQIDRPYSK